MRRIPALIAPVVVAVAAALAAPAASAAAVGWTPCPDEGFQAFECGSLRVPLDRAGSTPGAVELFARRLRAPENRANTAVVALAGGPGQAAAPLARSFAEVLAPGLRDRDLLVFDQRGTGLSDPLGCSALRRRGSTAAIVGACARELGARRGHYRTEDSVADLEALRAEAGYDRLVLFGVSYGTKVALDYAARHPSRVESLVLDSVVPPEGPDPLVRSSFVAARRILREQCASGRCAAVSPDPVADVRRLARRGAIRGTYIDGRGRSRRAVADAATVYRAYLTTDLNPAWRAQLAGATRAAVRGDTTPLLRALAQVVGGPTGSQSADESNTALFLATACEEVRFPWDRASGVAIRNRQADAALGATPSSVFAPFDRRAAARTSVMAQCLGWPHATPSPAAPAPLPGVPTLVLAGRADIRTPASDAVAVAARIPTRARVVTVPHVGHSVLGSDPSGCSHAAIAQFFREGTASACLGSGPLVPPLPRPVRRVGDLPPTGGIAGTTGRTLTAAVRTRNDALAQALGAQIAGGARAGGLRRGVITLRGGDVVLRNVEYVRGVRVDGVFPAAGDEARLRVSGSAARGTLTFHRDGRLTGRLGGRAIRLRPRPRARGAAATPRRGDWTGFAALERRAPLARAAGAAAAPPSRP